MAQAARRRSSSFLPPLAGTRGLAFISLAGGTAAGGWEGMEGQGMRSNLDHWLLRVEWEEGKRVGADEWRWRPQRRRGELFPRRCPD
jgi:hypothetical protein